MKFILVTLCILIAMLAIADPFKDYINKIEPKYKWDIVKNERIGGGVRYELSMISQEWQGIEWRHTIAIYKPYNLKHNDIALLFITGGRPVASEHARAYMAAETMGMAVVILYDIPNQPLFGDLNEDELIAYTFIKYLETNDSSFPLLLPMTKSAVKAMDVVQAFSQQELGNKINRFVVSGASKRGWTTWLTGAFDTRVAGIAPMVYDNLNLQAQMKHQVAAYGTYSEKIDDYSKVGLQEKLSTPKGTELAKLVDPYSYREKINIPKLIINGTNDPYWTVDSLNLYWSDLTGQKSIFYVPNVGHGLDGNRCYQDIYAFAKSIALKKPLPHMSWLVKKGAVTKLTVIAFQTSGVRVWVAKSPTKDFRKAVWESQEMIADKAGWTFSVAKPQNGYVAFYAEADYKIDELPFSQSSQVTVLGSE